MKPSYNCKYCKDEDENSFFSTNKSVCKKCISCRNKVRRKTVKSDDNESREFCINANIDFDTICRESEEKRLKGRKSTSSTPPNNSPISSTLLSTPLTQPTITSPIQTKQIETLEQTVTKLTTELKYLNDIMISRTEFNETGNMEVRRRQDEILADQDRAKEKYEELETNYKNLETKYNTLQSKHDILEALVIKTVATLRDNYYNKEAVAEKINSVIISNRNR